MNGRRRPRECFPVSGNQTFPTDMVCVCPQLWGPGDSDSLSGLPGRLSFLYAGELSLLSV